MFNSILLACDGSKHALRSAEKAIEITRGNPEAFISLIYVVDSNTTKSEVLAYGDHDRMDSVRHKKLSPVEDKFKKENIKFETKIIKGEPGPEIVKYANDHVFDLVIVGSRGLNTLQEMVLGSVSHKIAKRVKWPVLIVK